MDSIIEPKLGLIYLGLSLKPGPILDRLDGHRTGLSSILALITFFMQMVDITNLVECNPNDQITKYPQCPRTYIVMMPAPIISIVSDEGGNPICSTVSLLENIPNSHHDRKDEKVSDIIKDRMGI